MSVVDWFSKNKQQRYEQIKKAVAYLLLQAGVRIRLGFGPGTGTLPAPPPPFERDGVTPKVQTEILSQGDWLDFEFMPAYNTYIAAYEVWIDPAQSTPVAIQQFKDAEDTFVPLFRKLYAFVKMHPLTTNADLVGMGFPVPQHTHTPAPVPTSFPEALASHPAPATVVISFLDSESKKVRKPAGVHGAEIIWAILDTAPQDQDWDKLIHSEFDTASPFTLSFTGPDRGKDLYFALRWENTRGEKGPWSDIQQTIIS